MPRALAVASDPRVAALFLLAPAAAWFRGEGALDAVAVPVLMMSGDHDDLTTRWHAEIVEGGLTAAAPLEHRVVAGAGHYSFLSPYPPEMIGSGAPASLDPDGFDPPAFHEEMEGAILAFLRRVL